MIQQLINDFSTAYGTVMGNSRIWVVFLVSLLFLYLLRDKLEYNPFALILSPLVAVGTALTHAVKAAKEKKNKPVLFIAVFLCAFVVILTGERLYSGQHMSRAENTMHIPEDYRAAMDYILDKSENPSVAAMPDYSIYHKMYSSAFDMLYEQRYGDDVRYLSEDARTVFNELSDRNPDMLKVSEAAKNSGIDYIVLREDHYWPVFPLEKYDYQIEATIDGWIIYSGKEINND